MELNDLTYKINGAVFEVNRVLGSGFLEKVYEKALLIELRNQGLAAEAQLLNYLKATGYEVGLLINFTHPKAQIKRFIF